MTRRGGLKQAKVRGKHPKAHFSLGLAEIVSDSSQDPRFEGDKIIYRS